jgi:hypothetical protein
MLMAVLGLDQKKNCNMAQVMVKFQPEHVLDQPEIDHVAVFFLIQSKSCHQHFIPLFYQIGK